MLSKLPSALQAFTTRISCRETPESSSISSIRKDSETAMLGSSSVKTFHQRRWRCTYDSMLSEGCRDKGPPICCPARKSSFPSSKAEGKTWFRMVSMSCARPPGRDRVSNPKSLAKRTASPLRPSTVLLTKMLLSEGVFCLPCDESDFGEAAVFGDAADFGDGTCWPEKGNSSSFGSQLLWCSYRVSKWL